MLIAIPLHPAIVHFPIALTVLMPAVIGAVWWAERRGWVSAVAWRFVAGLQSVVFATSFLAQQLGEHDEEIVKHVIDPEIIEAHAAWGDRVVWVTGMMLVLLLGAALFPRLRKFRVVVLAAALVAIVPVIFAGHSGAGLVYEHDAARAHQELIAPE